MFSNPMVIHQPQSQPGPATKVHSDRLRADQMRVRMGAVYFVLLVSLRADPRGPRGTVSDPHGLAVPGAQVTLTCGQVSRVVRTDGRGRFVFAATDDARDCGVSVARPGFTTFHDIIGEPSAELSVHLSLAPVREVVNVVAGQSDADALLQPTLDGISLSSEELQRISNSTVDLIRYAKLLAGAFGTPEAVRVDGLPATELPPAEMIARITVNADPFSAEYADGDRTSIDITTRSRDRHFRFNLDGGSLGVGGHQTLRPGLRSASQAEGFSLSGAVPHLPFTFSVHMNAGYNSNDMPIQAVLPLSLSSSGVVPEKASSTSRASSASLDIYYSGREALRSHFSYYQSRSTSSNLGVGGLTLPEAGFSSSSISQGGRATLSDAWGHLTYRGAFAFSASDSHTEPNSKGVGLSVLGSFITGGATVGSGEFTRSQWTWKNTLQSDSPGGPWTAGFTISRTADFSQQTPNAAGGFTFENLQAFNDALAGEGTATWLVTRGNGTIRYGSLAVAPFLQKTLVRSAHVLISGGVRVDYQSGVEILVSPRLAMAAQWKGFVFRTGGGLFVRNVPDIVFEKAIAGDGLHLQQFMATDVPFGGSSELHPEDEALIRTHLGPGFAAPREFMQKTSLERSFGGFTPGMEYTWTRDWHLLGSRRLADGADWMDLLESDRVAERQRLHTQLRYRTKAQTLIASYDLTRARDNTDSPFSFPADQNNIRAEWSRSAGASPHSFALASLFQLPAGLFLTLTDTWTGSTPYNITSGLDVAGDGLHTDRGGRTRNSGNGPGLNSLQLYASRRVALPVLRLPNRARIYVNLGVQGENLLGNKNYVGFGSVAGSPSFGVPLGTLPGRSVRVWFNLD